MPLGATERPERRQLLTGIFGAARSRQPILPLPPPEPFASSPSAFGCKPNPLSHHHSAVAISHPPPIPITHDWPPAPSYTCTTPHITGPHVNSPPLSTQNVSRFLSCMIHPSTHKARPPRHSCLSDLAPVPGQRLWTCPGHVPCVPAPHFCNCDVHTFATCTTRVCVFASLASASCQPVYCSH